MAGITTDASVLGNKEINFVDMHHHSTASDGGSSPKLLAKVFRKKGFGLCIADHNQIKGSVYLARKTDVFTIPSVEITTRESKDQLAYFYNVNDLESFWNNEIKNKIRDNAGFNMHKTTIGLMDLLDRIKEYNGIAVLPHPAMPRIFGIFRNPKESSMMLGNSEFLKKIDAVESHNFINGFNKKNIRIIKNTNKPLTAGTDSHLVSPFNSLTGTHEFEPGDFLDAVLKKKNIIYYRDNKRLRRHYEKLVVFKNNVQIKAQKNK